MKYHAGEYIKFRYGLSEKIGMIISEHKNENKYCIVYNNDHMIWINSDEVVEQAVDIDNKQ